jgi:hypothetical protein
VSRNAGVSRIESWRGQNRQANKNSKGTGFLSERNRGSEQVVLGNNDVEVSTTVKGTEPESEQESGGNEWTR